jgi:hypothetical protein
MFRSSEGLDLLYPFGTHNPKISTLENHTAIYFFLVVHVMFGVQ